jgi:hypothetical protein
LEASVRAPENWHPDAIGTAYVSGDKDWMLTAVLAAGSSGLAAAWSHMVALVDGAGTPKPLLLAAIGAVASIRSAEARRILVDLADSDDEEVAEAADEAIGMAAAASDEEDDEEVGSD